MTLDLLAKTLGQPSAVTHSSGPYAWYERARRPRRWRPGQVLYVGESGDVAARIADQRSWAAEYAEQIAAGADPWTPATCGLAVILVMASDPVAVMWPCDGDAARMAKETAAIRLLALAGLTPPANGAGWDWDRGRSSVDRLASPMLYQWFEDNDWRAWFPWAAPHADFGTASDAPVAAPARRVRRGDGA